MGYKPWGEYPNESAGENVKRQPVKVINEKDPLVEWKGGVLNPENDDRPAGSTQRVGQRNQGEC
jgi:hypothetical protein